MNIFYSLVRSLVRSIMPLRIKLPLGERIVVNGAVIESASDSASLIFHNTVDILRGKEILTEEAANTPARRIYYSVQCAYLFEADREEFISTYKALRDQYLEAAPSAQLVCLEIDDKMLKGEFYPALRTAQKLIDHEAALFAAVNYTKTPSSKK